MATPPRILVIGDIMLDQYVSGKVTRISPEAPVPIVKVDKEWSTLGGAGNVAANVSALGGQAVLFGLVGNDVSGELVLDACDKAGIETAVFRSNQPTIVKTRVVSGQQIVRFDREEALFWTARQIAQLKTNLIEQVQKSNLILLSDYAKGTLSDEVLKLIFELSRQYQKPVFVDPKRSNWECYRGAFLITPNLAELELTELGKGIKNEDNAVVSVCNSLRSQFGVANIVATRSSYGMTLVSENGILNIPTRALEVYDVSGAGDTVLAALGVSFAEGKTLAESAFAANAAAGIVVGKLGTALVHRSELETFIKSGSKLVSIREVSRLRAQNETRKVVFTNGCFDVLHQGHRMLLKEAKALGDLLVVGLNSDDSIKRLKGAQRPINSVNQRIEALAALPSVDTIIVFEDDTPHQLLEELRPNILVKGGDYNPNEIVGREFAEQIVVIPLVEGISTTNLLEQ
ncbi:MAG: bifunctional heptose 7-phosphate kinase/heptose 1-phosphate adenyltransferase [Flavobacteriales bacterium]|nr:bifunctional heptose 7-phosphate kinase/heptose 1-phosphate adenyltransferase [Flavobacteriales bacterium]